MTENTTPVRIPVPQLKAINDKPLYRDIRELLDGCAKEYGEETAKAIDKDGWLHTGDMGWFGEDGYLRLTGRIKDLIIRGGENISPAEIENAALEDPQIADCRAIGIPDDHYGEEICLCVILRRDSTRNALEIKEELEKKLAAFKVPKYILFMQSFPKNPTGKIITKELKAAALSKLHVKI